MNQFPFSWLAECREPEAGNRDTIFSASENGIPAIG
jgi:hypothetical protein